MTNNNSTSNPDTKETPEDSISDLLGQVFRRAIELTYLPDLMTTRRQPTGMEDALWDTVWAYSDGLPQQRIDRMLGGRCSFSALLAFDLEEEEKQLLKDLEDFKKYEPGAMNVARVY